MFFGKKNLTFIRRKTHSLYQHHCHILETNITLCCNFWFGKMPKRNWLILPYQTENVLVDLYKRTILYDTDVAIFVISGIQGNKDVHRKEALFYMQKKSVIILSSFVPFCHTIFTFYCPSSTAYVT